MRLRHGTFLRLLGLCLGFFLVSFTGVASAQYQDTAVLSDSVVAQGEEVVFSGGGFAPDSEVTIVLGGEVLGTVDADAQGNFVAFVTIPCDFPTGPTTIAGRGQNATGGTRTVTANLTVTEGECPDGAPRRVAPRGEAQQQAGLGRAARGRGLPETGQASTAPLVAAGVGLVLIGTVAVATARRRRTDGATSGL